MQIHAITIRPETSTVVVLYVDKIGNRDSLVFDTTNPKVQAVIEEYRAQLPPDTENPAKEEIEQEIAELEYRLSQLKESIGAPG